MSIPISEKIELIRQAENLSQAELCLRLDISLNTFKAIIKRGSSPRFEVVEKIAKEWPHYAFWLLTEKTNPPDHVSPVSESYERVLFDVIEFIDQKDLISGDSFVDKSKMHSVIFLVEDTNTNRRMKVLISVWVDELSHYRKSRGALFGSPVICMEPNFELYYPDGKGSAIKFKKWCDKNNINKFSLQFVNVDVFTSMEKSRLLLESDLLPYPERRAGANKILSNFDDWKSGAL